MFICSAELKTLLEKEFLDSKEIVFFEVNDKTFEKIIPDKKYVFIVKDGKYIYQLLDYKPIGFIRKQMMNEDIENIKKFLKQQPKKELLTFNHGGNQLSVTPDKILYLEAQSHYVLIYTTSVTFKVREKISDLIKRLASYGFKQVHRSYLINEHHLVGYLKDECLLRGDIRVPLSKKYH